MKVFVMRVGNGLALPLPVHVASLLGLGPGSELELQGPAPDGTLRYVPVPAGRPAVRAGEAAPEAGRPAVRAGEAAPEAGRPAPAAVPVPVPAPAAPPLELPTPTDVVRAVSPSPPPRSLGQEIDELIGRHAATLREVAR